MPRPQRGTSPTRSANVLHLWLVSSTSRPAAISLRMTPHSARRAPGERTHKTAPVRHMWGLAKLAGANTSSSSAAAAVGGGSGASIVLNRLGQMPQLPGKPLQCTPTAHLPGSMPVDGSSSRITGAPPTSATYMGVRHSLRVRPASCRARSGLPDHRAPTISTTPCRMAAEICVFSRH